MKKIVLMLGIVICFANKTYAETWNCGPKTNGVYSDSVKCTYDETSKTLTVSGEGPMGNFPWIPDQSTETPWRDKDIVHAVIEGNVTTIGDRVFKNLYNLQDITGTENITRVGVGAFAYSSLKSIDLPNVQEISGRAFGWTSSLEYVGIPDNINYTTDEDGTPGDTFQASALPNCENTGECWSCGEKFVQAGVGCVSSCYTGYTSYYGFCTRTR
ncbi:MAG: leucine-rich repeat protein, partial [Alphaproteobacteria bacterium]|nr:leucine-rich repeat protein [Alphaproteobacteria bacterium]